MVYLHYNIAALYVSFYLEQIEVVYPTLKLEVIDRHDSTQIYQLSHERERERKR